MNRCKKVMLCFDTPSQLGTACRLHPSPRPSSPTGGAPLLHPRPSGARTHGLCAPAPPCAVRRIMNRCKKDTPSSHALRPIAILSLISTGSAFSSILLHPRPSGARILHYGLCASAPSPHRLCTASAPPLHRLCTASAPPSHPSFNHGLCTALTASPAKRR